MREQRSRGIGIQPGGSESGKLESGIPEVAGMLLVLGRLLGGEGGGIGIGIMINRR